MSIIAPAAVGQEVLGLGNNNLASPATGQEVLGTRFTPVYASPAVGQEVLGVGNNNLASPATVQEVLGVQQEVIEDGVGETHSSTIVTPIAVVSMDGLGETHSSTIVTPIAVVSMYASAPAYESTIALPTGVSTLLGGSTEAPALSLISSTPLIKPTEVLKGETLILSSDTPTGEYLVLVVEAPTLALTSTLGDGLVPIIGDAIAPSLTLVIELGGVSFTLPDAVGTTMTLSVQAGVAVQGISVEPHVSTRTANIGGGRLGVAEISTILYKVSIDELDVPASFISISQNLDGATNVEVRAIGTIARNEWAIGAIGKSLKVRTAAYGSAGNYLGAEVMVVSEITSVQQVTNGIKVYGLASTEERPSQTIPVETILYMQERSTGVRTIRCPVSWNVQAGDVLTHESIAPLTINRIYTTIDRSYRMMEVTEAAA